MRNQFPRSAQFRFPVSKCAIALLCCAFSGGLDILVNNAGILIRGVVDDYSLKDFDRMVAVNVRAVFIAIKAAVPHLKNGGRIITTGSVVADRSGFPGASVYSMTKAAVAALTRGLARDLGSRAITANVIQPGPTETDMNANPAVHDTLRTLMAVGRMGKDVEAASLVAYLARPEASFITGSAITIDGGYLA
jgi:3-oxoacyl-[acyl-carrier protein] reductase